MQTHFCWHRIIKSALSEWWDLFLTSISNCNRIRLNVFVGRRKYQHDIKDIRISNRPYQIYQIYKVIMILHQRKMLKVVNDINARRKYNLYKHANIHQSEANRTVLAHLLDFSRAITSINVMRIWRIQILVTLSKIHRSKVSYRVSWNLVIQTKCFKAISESFILFEWILCCQ